MPRLQKDSISIDLLRSFLAYVPETGEFFWKIDSHGCKRAGDRAGGIAGRGYRRIFVGRKIFSEHRLAIAFTTGAWPTGNVDHINGDTSDNRRSNLRDVHQSLNVSAAHGRKFLRTGQMGIRFKAGSWEASIKYMGNSHYLGRFKDKASAQQAYLSAANRLHGEGQFSLGAIGAAGMADGMQFIAPKKMRLPLTQERLVYLVDYNPATGEFKRLVSFRYAGREAGAAIGQPDREGYLHAKIDGKAYVLHRLAWLYMTGEWPAGEIHHINHNPGDNSWQNLADVTRLENNRMRRRSGPIPRLAVSPP